MTRQAAHEIDPMFTDRWSPRSFVEKELSEAELLRLFEAARWAPSSSNNQPWHFIHARKGEAAFDVMLDLQVPFNQMWTKTASAFVVIASRKTFAHNGKANITHSFDTGMAVMSMLLQAQKQGLATHLLAGFDYEKAQSVLQIPEGYAVEAMLVVGYAGSPDVLPDMLRERESPSTRDDVAKHISAGVFTH